MLNFSEFNNYTIFIENQKIVVPLKENDNQDDQLLNEVRDDVEKCVAKVMGLYKFFGRFIYRLRIIYTYRVPTMGVDMFNNLFINPKFASTLTDKEMIFVLCHEVMHLVLTHIPRGITKGVVPSDSEGWNIAADYETNALLVDEGLLTEDEVHKMKALLDKKYYEMIAEAIYDAKPPQPKSKQQEYPAEIGDYVKTKSGDYGQITAINADGSYKIKPVTIDEVRKALSSK